MTYSQKSDLSGQVCIVTGAGGNLGRAVAIDLAGRGARVVATVRRASDKIENENVSTEIVDLTDSDAVTPFVARILAEHGRIDALVNAAGGYRGGPTLGETPLDDWRVMRSVNLETALICCRAVLPGMVAGKHGRIVNIASRAAVQPFGGAAPYIVAKAAVISLTEAVAAETQGTGVTVNVILPSVIDTPENRAAMADADYSKWVSPEAIAKVVAWLISEPTGLVNGARIPVYGRA